MRRYLDYSRAKLSGFSIRRDGYDGVIRYIDAPNLLRTKHTDLAEYRDHIANGLTVYLVFQNNTTDADGGYAAGVANATRARAGAEYLGYTGVIFFTNDRTTIPNVAAWRAYLDGAASVLGSARVGAYGFRNAMDTAVGHAAAFWQSGSQSLLAGHTNIYQWNNGRVYPDGLECDLNYVYSDYFPQGGGSGHLPVPAQDNDEDTMFQDYIPAHTAEDIRTIPWDGSKAVLNVIATTNNIIYVGKPLCWGPNGGTGGGNPTVAGVNPGRVGVNQPGQYDIPAGTTRIVYSSSCLDPHWVNVVRVN